MPLACMVVIFYSNDAGHDNEKDFWKAETLVGLDASTLDDELPFFIFGFSFNHKHVFLSNIICRRGKMNVTKWLWPVKRFFFHYRLTNMW